MATADTNPPSGTRDFLAPEVARRERAFDTVRSVFRRHGFEPLETPAIERLDVLLGKYGEEGDQLLFKILRRGEHEQSGDADLGLRYDLTVPLARVVAQYGEQLAEPYKRYHLAPVWRAERAQRGRYREFVQCDVDVVGSSSLLADAEVVLTVIEALVALGIDDPLVQLNSRHAVRGLIEAYGVPVELEDTTLVALDKRDKVGVDGVARELRSRGVPDPAASALTGDLAATDAAERVAERIASVERGKAGLTEVDELLTLLEGAAPGTLRRDPFLARGLSYYTGPIFEVRTGGLASSIASGGRYDGLVGSLAGRDLPATGGSVGLERVLLLADAAAPGETAAQVLVALFDPDDRADVLRLAQRLREEGLRVDLYLDEDRLGKQLKYAERRGIRYCVLRGADERAAGTGAIKDLRTGEQDAVPLDGLGEELRRRLGQPS